MKIVKKREKTIVCDGFTLIEWLVSFFITTLLVTLVFQFSTQFYINVLSRSKFNAVLLENYAALDHISRNIAQAPMVKEKWKIGLETNNCNKLVWYDDGHKAEIGYLFLGEKLYFLMGQNGERKNLIASNITNLVFSPKIIDGNVISVTCSMLFTVDNRSKKFERLIVLKSRLIR